MNSFLEYLKTQAHPTSTLYLCTSLLIFASLAGLMAITMLAPAAAGFVSACT